ncbi:MAG: tetratricopeptide repeat protein [Shewanella sp.]|nr:tetratricopeptide repeat protein [Shewanella sp.]MCF1429867.1 tetratricopeptide repeat protein [Shewanella sp.]MCF1439941.1 tetratricopeptide repeat protein [Shewanella sp.]MCF1457823.1 tetratricopeptide repeat protein [Shewanella sp.]
MSELLPSEHSFCVDSSLKTLAVSLPETALEIAAHLGLSDLKRATWAWLELSGAVLSHYLVDQEARLQRLIRWYYQELGFKPKENYFGADAADLGYCLLHREGNSTTLAVVLMLLGKQLDLALEPVLLPGHTLLLHRRGKERRYLDPLSGKFVSHHYIHALVRGEMGNSARLKPAHIKPVKLKRLLTRMLHELKSGCIVSNRFESALECCNLLLQWHPDDIHIHRERAFIAQQLGCITLAASDLQYFVEQNPHDPMIELVKMQLRDLSEHAETYH